MHVTSLGKSLEIHLLLFGQCVTAKYVQPILLHFAVGLTTASSGEISVDLIRVIPDRLCQNGGPKNAAVN
jgi:hypothetical protein